MKPSKQNLITAVKLCANAHERNFEDWSEDDQVAVQGDSVPIVSDMRMICEAFYGNRSFFECDWGYTTIWIDDSSFSEKVDMSKLIMALPVTTNFSVFE